MSTLISQIVIGLLAVLTLAFVIAFFTKKRKRSPHPQNEIVNDTSYNIASRETDSNTSPEETREKNYLDRMQKGDKAPLNRKDFYNYKK